MFFLAARDLQRLLENLRLHRLLAEQALGVAQLVLKGAIVRGRNDLLLRPGRRERTLSRKPTPTTHLVRRNAVPARHQANRDARLVRLRHDGYLFRRRPPATSLRPSQDLTLRIIPSHRHDITPTSYRSGRPCPVN